MLEWVVLIRSTEVHVMEFIDRGLASFAADQRQLFDQGLADLNGGWAGTPPGSPPSPIIAVSGQIALLHALEAEQSVGYYDRDVASEQ